MKLLIRLKYLGTDFCGWQYQPNARTVQGVLTDAANTLFKTKCAVTGCSRTDSGVHANDFAATIEVLNSDNDIPPDRIPVAMANLLPSDVAVVSAVPVNSDFHPRYDVVYKEYVYLILASPVCDPFLFGRVWHYPKKLADNAINLMNECAAELVGTHDFSAFMATGSKIKDTVRTVKYCRVENIDGNISIKIAADGFLYNMVRIIAGTLMLAAQGKLNFEGMRDIILSGDRKNAGITAPPSGLYLNKVIYEKDI